jgi:hypothetical protein
VSADFPVLVDAADGPVIVWHTQAELDRYYQGVDREAALLLSRPLKREDADPSD